MNTMSSTCDRKPSFIRTWWIKESFWWSIVLVFLFKIEFQSLNFRNDQFDFLFKYKLMTMIQKKAILVCKSWFYRGLYWNYWADRMFVMMFKFDEDQCNVMNVKLIHPLLDLDHLYLCSYLSCVVCNRL